MTLVCHCTDDMSFAVKLKLSYLVGDSNSSWQSNSPRCHRQALLNMSNIVLCPNRHKGKTNNQSFPNKAPFFRKSPATNLQKSRVDFILFHRLCNGPCSRLYTFIPGHIMWLIPTGRGRDGPLILTPLCFLFLLQTVMHSYIGRYNVGL